MKTLLIKNGKIIIDTLNEVVFDGDLLIEKGRIKRIDKNINDNVDQIIDAKGNYVCPGFIDIHTHCYPVGVYGLTPDVLGVERYSSTIVDAGTSGSLTFEDFKNNYIDKAKTKVFALINLSKEGLKYGHELDDLDKLDPNGVIELVKKYPDIIVGLKARASKSVVGDLDILPIKNSADLAHQLKVPLMVHIGNYPPALSDVLNLLEKGDLITHSFHGKANGLIQNGNIIKEAILARNRGVYFDIGHGQDSFSFNTYLNAKDLGFYTDSISTDLHKSSINGPVYSLIECVNKIINMNESLFKAIDKVTRVPAHIFKLKELGELKLGYIGDIFIFSYDDTNQEVIDSNKDTLILHSRINPIKLIISNNEESEVIVNKVE